MTARRTLTIPRLIPFVALSVLALAAPASAAHPEIAVAPTGFNVASFSLSQHSYVARCDPDAATLRVRGAKGWRVRVGSGAFKPGGAREALDTPPGVRTRISLKRHGSSRIRSYDVRCLPADFPDYAFNRVARGGPRHFFVQLGNQYAAIFDGNGVPVWWYKASGEPDNAQILPDGTIAFDPVDQASFQVGDYEVRTLSGRLLRVVRGVDGAKADIHEIQLLPNGNYLIGAQDVYQADTSAYGGSADSEVIGIELQEVSPDGDLAWHWDSRDHIDLSETGRWWGDDAIGSGPYDIVHWNSAEPDGRFMVISFRHLDAVYKIDTKTGEIVWKLGGTLTPQSLDVVGDPHGDYPLGGQHDARLQPDGTLTVHDNRSGLNQAPRAVRYRIDENAGTATLLQSISEPDVPGSFCCGSARRLPSKDWLIDWGGNGVVGAYAPDGSRLFDFRLGTGFSYRANPVPDGLVTRSRLRESMDKIADRSKAG